MILDKDKALKIADFLLQIKAVKLQPNDPFTWASGWNSPIYCDNRKTLSFPKIRTAIRQTFAQQIDEKYTNIDAIAGVATGGIAIGALVAEEMGLPFIYVRSSAKGHGLGNQIEGAYEEGQRVVVIEDLISTGGSSLKAVTALRENECNVLGMVAIFTYGFELSKNNFEPIVEKVYLSTFKSNHIIGTFLPPEVQSATFDGKIAFFPYLSLSQT